MPIFPSFFVNKTGGYEIEQSLRFDGGSYLNRTPGSAGNRRTCTLSFWFKWESQGGEGVFLWASGRTKLAIDPGGFDALSLDDYDGSYNIRKLTTQSLRDPSAWYHAVVVMDTTNATAGDRHRLYLNGERVTAFSASTDSGQNFDTEWNNNVEHRIGADNNPFYFRGYIAEMHMLDGTAVTDAEDFGEYDDNGVWRPIQVSGVTYGTNGYYLTFDPSATNGIGHDHSGNGNNWTANNFTTSGTGTDVMSDTPTTNWATLNPIDKGSAVTLSDGNLVYSKGSSTWDNSGVRGTFAVSSGKWYWEITKNSSTSYSMYGVATSAASFSEQYSAPNESWTYISDSGNKFGDGSGGAGTSYGATFTNGDVIGVALDMDAGTLVFYKNGTSQGTAFSTLSGETVFPWVHLNASGDSAICNFGQRDFEYTPPTGFKALNTSNLPAPDIADGSDYFNTILWAGDNANPRTLTGVGFQPDWVWLKDRTQSTNHRLVDAVRGAGNTLKSNNTSSETSSEAAGTITAFTSDGFTVEGTSNVEGVNLSGDNFVAWNWLAGNGTSSNTDGTATNTVTVSASPTAGFSIVTYSGQSTNFTWGHGLGVPPSMVIIKGRTNTAGWSVYHSALGATKRLALNTTDAAETMSYFQNTEPTSTVFSVTTNGGTGANGVDYIAYCFAEVEGYSKFGSYTGNGSTDGPFVFTGHKVAWVMIKDTTGSGNSWYISDNKRNTYNVVNGRLMANLSNGESTSVSICDFTANGFKIRTNDSGWNTSGSTYVFASFAENPFGGSGVSPATAR